MSALKNLIQTDGRTDGQGYWNSYGKRKLIRMKKVIIHEYTNIKIEKVVLAGEWR